jgi:hypothetical protein
MTGTAPEPPATPAPPVTADDHAYFRVLEEEFLRLRGKATLLSAADWQVAQGWHRAGIPIEIVVQVMAALFTRAREKRKRTISALSYFKAAVEAAWEEVEALSAGGRKERLEPFRVEDRLRRLAGSLGAALPGQARWSMAITSLSGELEEVEKALTELDRQLLDELAAALPETERRAHAATVESALSGVAKRLPPEELERARTHLGARLLRERFGVPVLSLFAPAARGEAGEGAS